MDKKKLLELLNNVKGDGEESNQDKRILLIDGLNLFFRNFAMLNIVNSRGAHIGGLGGFFKSLGALIKHLRPTSVYVVFDGVGSSHNRKNLIPEYKGGRNSQRITNWEVFEDHSEEDDSKIDQLVRIIQYLKTLPVIVISINKVEADDIIAYLSMVLPPRDNSKVFIVSSDKDFLQLVNENVTVYRPIIKQFFTPQLMEEKYGIPAKNFTLYKTLLGDNSDNIKGVKGLGEKGILKKFPEMREKVLTLDDIYEICVKKYKEHVVYARIVQNIEELEKNYKVMDLNNPMINEDEKQYINDILNTKQIHYHPEQFLQMYNQDELGGIIRNVNLWLRENFEHLNK